MGLPAQKETDSPMYSMGEQLYPRQCGIFHKHPTCIKRVRAAGLTADIDGVSPSVSSVRRRPGRCARQVYGVSGQWPKIRLLGLISK